MNQAMSERSSHAFIVRIWFEPREVPNSPVQWRGVVQYVASGQQRYFNTSEQLIAFITQESGLSDLDRPDTGA